MAVGLFSHKIPISDPAELAEHLAAAGRPVLVEFAEKDSPACQIEAPILEDLGRRYAGRLEVLKADVAASPEVAARFNVRAVPTFVVFVGGEERLRLVGFQDIEDLTRVVEAALLPVASA